MRNRDIKDKILQAALKDVPFEGWTWTVMEKAAVTSGYSDNMAMAVFPDKMDAVLKYFSEWVDRQMIDALTDCDLEQLKIRERIQLAVEKRLEVLIQHKEAARAATVYWLVPTRKLQAGKQVWKTADCIWNWAGDQAEDYNHYTKRVLLSGVITATVMAWLNDETEDFGQTREFLSRRIDNVLKIAGSAGKILGPLLSRASFLNKKKAKA